MPVRTQPPVILRRSHRSNTSQSHKSFRTKQKLARAQKQNRPIPQWIRLRTGNTIRYAQLPLAQGLRHHYDRNDGDFTRRNIPLTISTGTTPSDDTGARPVSVSRRLAPAAAILSFSDFSIPFFTTNTRTSDHGIHLRYGGSHWSEHFLHVKDAWRGMVGTSPHRTLSLWRYGV